MTFWSLWLLNTPKKVYWCRVAFSFGYLTIAVVLVCYRWNEMFYFKHLDSYQFDRYLWCISMSFLGFFFVAVQHWDNPNSPVLKYTLYYPVLLFVISALVFSIVHMFEASRGFVFYYLSFSMCFILGFLVDQFWDFVLSIVKRLVPGS